MVVGLSATDPRLELYNDPVKLMWAMGYDGVTDELHGEAMRFLLSQKRAWVEFPRGHYKSTCMSIGLVIWLLLRNPSERILLMSAALNLVQDFISQINQKLRGDLRFESGLRVPFATAFPWMKVGSYSVQKGLNVVGRRGNNPDRSVFALGVGSSAAGRHPTIIITDDLSNEQNSRTLAQREKVIDAYSTLTPLAKDMDCPIWNIGTPWELGDFSCYAKETLKLPTFRRHFWGGPPRPSRPEQFRPDKVDEAKGWTGWPLDPNIMSAEQMEQIETFGSDKFVPYHRRSAWYYCDPVSGDYPTFTRDLVNASHRYDLTAFRLKELEGYEVALVDPAYKPERHHDHSGITVVRVLRACDLHLDHFPPSTNIYIPVEAHDIPEGTGGLLHAMREIAKRRGDPKTGLLRGFLVEGAAYQDSVGPWFYEELPHGVKVASVKGIAAGKGKDFRSMGLAAAMGEGRFALPPDFPGHDLLCKALLEYNPRDRDDLVDSAALISMLPREGDPLPKPRVRPEPGTLASQLQYLDSLNSGATTRKWGM